MVEYNLCFCNDDCKFYIVNHENVSDVVLPNYISGYQVDSHELFNLNISIQSFTPENINTLYIYKIFASTFTLDTLIYNDAIQCDFLQDVDLMRDIGHCLINCIHTLKIQKQNLVIKREKAETSLQNCFNKILSIRSKCEQLEDEIQVA